MTTYYLHTLDDKPAYFDPETDTILFRTPYGKAGPLALSLRQIYREQRLDKKNNPRTSEDFKYGHCRVRVEKGR